MELLGAALAPLLEHLQAWLAHGLLADPCHEFFIVAGTPTCSPAVTVMCSQLCTDGSARRSSRPDPECATGCRVAGVPLTIVDLMTLGQMGMCLHTGADVQVDSPEFWRSGYHARSSSDGTGAAAPGFMLPLLDGILAAGKARVLLRHEQAAAAPQAAADYMCSRSAAAGSSATDDSQHAEHSLSQLCQDRLRAALLAQLEAARNGCGSTMGNDAISRSAAAGAQGGPAAGMRAAAAAQSLAPALSEPVGHAVSAAPTGSAAVEADHRASAMIGCWPQPVSSWSASLQQVTACLPPLLPPPPPLRSQTVSSSSSQGSSFQRLSITATRSPIVHASAEELLNDCVLGAVRRQVSACSAALSMLPASRCSGMSSDTQLICAQSRRWPGCNASDCSGDLVLQKSIGVADTGGIGRRGLAKTSAWQWWARHAAGGAAGPLSARSASRCRLRLRPICVTGRRSAAVLDSHMPSGHFRCAVKQSTCWYSTSASLNPVFAAQSRHVTSACK